MKHIIVLFALIALLMLGGCRLDPDGLLGNDPAEKEEMALHGYDVSSLCREQTVAVTNVQNATGCATPANLVEILSGMEVGKDHSVRLQFRKMWDGTFPKLVRLDYHKWENGTSASPKEVPCQIDSSVTDLRVYECRLKETTNELWGEFTLQTMVLGHDTCASRAEYSAKFLFDFCTYPDNEYYLSVPEVYFNRQLIPSLSPRSVEANP